MSQNYNIIQLYEPVSTCPQCKGQLWLIYVNGFYNDYDKITKHECYECGWSLNIDVEVVKD